MLDLLAIHFKGTDERFLSNEERELKIGIFLVGTAKIKMYQSGLKCDGQLFVETAIQKGHLKKKPE